MNSSVMHGTLDKLLLNAVSDLKKTLRKPAKINIRHVVQSTLVRNSIVNIHLPLMIFIRMHSQESQFHNKCLICSIKFNNYVHISPFVRAFGKQIETCVQLPAERLEENSKKLYYWS